jgi:hypothetical protein
LTETGAFHIEWLHLNRPQLVHYRRERQLLQAARQSETRVLQVLGELKERVQAAIEGLDAFLRS